ncbi:DUF2806 domain-containing protein [Paraburkholderia sediminicola]|uniref:DUF2806 domain-containing protein n=1 Tax=Paraburkholderia sediminicola TaxID=458836 RepID=UPI0038BCAA57
MDIPGEKLIIKLWESLADRGVGSLLKPWQIRREAHAQLEVRRNELLLLAQTERDVDEIRKGNKKVESGGKSLLLLSSGTEVIEGRAEPVLDMGSLLAQADERKRADALREEVNTAKTILQAEELLKNESAPVPDRSIEPDWLYRWRDCAAQVSSEEMQSLWAKVLAEEVKAPGAHSFRTLEFLKNLSRAEAEAIQRLCPLVVNGQFILKYGEMANDPNGSLDHVLQMQELGIISGVGGLGLTTTYRHNGTDSAFAQGVQTLNKVVIGRTSDVTKSLVLPIYRITPLGREVLSLNPMPAPESYLQAIAQGVKTQGFETSIAQYVLAPNQPDQITLFNEVKV